MASRTQLGWASSFIGLSKKQKLVEKTPNLERSKRVCSRKAMETKISPQNDKFVLKKYVAYLDPANHNFSQIQKPTGDSSFPRCIL